MGFFWCRGLSQSIIDASILKTTIGYEKTLALPVFHVFTTCDTVSLFKIIGKKTAWERWSSFDAVAVAFLDLNFMSTTVTTQPVSLKYL